MVYKSRENDTDSVVISVNSWKDRRSMPPAGERGWKWKRIGPRKPKRIHFAGQPIGPAGDDGYNKQWSGWLSKRFCRGGTCRLVFFDAASQTCHTPTREPS